MWQFHIVPRAALEITSDTIWVGPPCLGSASHPSHRRRIEPEEGASEGETGLFYTSQPVNPVGSKVRVGCGAHSECIAWR
jgi:hypothetical protein